MRRDLGGLAVAIAGAATGAAGAGVAAGCGPALSILPSNGANPLILHLFCVCKHVVCGTWCCYFKGVPGWLVGWWWVVVIMMVVDSK